MPKSFAICLTAAVLAAFICFAQPALAQEPAANSAKTLDHVLGTVTAVDRNAHTVTVKEDKTDAEYTIQLQNTKTLLKVEPGAKDLKSATRINADDLEVGDRVDIRGTKTEDNAKALAARSVVLMSARDLQKAHEAQAAAWQQSTAGVVTSVDPAAQTLSINVRTPEGPKPMVVQAPKTTEFTRYSPDTPKNPVPSQLADIQPGDQVRVIGEKSADGESITAQKLYSGAFRTIAGTVSSISPDGKELTIKNLQTNKPVQVVLTDDSAIRKLPPMMAMALARQFNPDYKPQGGAGGSGGAGTNGNTDTSSPNRPRGGEGGGGNPPGANGGWRGSGAGGQGGAGGPGGGMRARGGDLSQMLDHIPKISVSDLKQGDAVLISGAAVTPDNSRLIATNVIAGVEPIFQSAPPRQGQSLNSGDWGFGDMAAPPGPPQ